MDMYKEMPDSKGKFFMFQQAWMLLEHSEKWRLRDQEFHQKRSILHIG
jgi:hypothetical protein